MRTEQLATWNVLHRVHAVNWGEPAIEAFPDEDARIAAITQRIANEGGTLALQEVSGDQLASLRAAGLAVVSAEYPRVPRYRGDEPALPKDRTEHLAIVGGDVVGTSHDSFPSDRGKGWLAAEFADGLLVISAHVSFGAARSDQLAAIAARMRAHSGPVALLGDFNADRVAVAADLGPMFVIAALPIGGPTTRPRVTGANKSQDIDHLVALGGTWSDVVVKRVDGQSDHNLVSGRFCRD